MTKGDPRTSGGRALPVLLFALLLAAVYFDPLFLRRNFAGRDLLPYHLPIEAEIHDAYARGRFPLWSDAVSGGRPLLPNPNAGALYPARPLLAPLPFPAAMRVFPVLHWLVAGAGLVFLVRALGGSAAAAFVGGVTYAFSGVGVSEVFFTNIHPGMALLPWIAWATVRLGGRGGVVRLGALYALDLLAGDVFTVALAAGASALWIARGVPAAERRSRAGGLAAALGLALLAAAPQVAASLLWAPLTRRGIVGLKLDEALTFSLSPWRLAELVVPYPFGATWALDGAETWGRLAFRNFFASLYCGALAPIALALSFRRRDAPAAWARAVLWLALALAVLPALVPASWRDAPSPVPLRYPEKFAVGAVFALAVLSALALDARRETARSPRGLLAAAAVLAALAAAASLAPRAAGASAARAVGAPPAAEAEAARQLPPALAEGGLLFAATVVALELFRSARPPVAVAGVVLLAAIPVLANRRIARTFSEAAVFSPTAFERFLRRRDAGAAFPARVLDASRYRPDTPSAAGPAGDPGGLEFYRRRWFFYTGSLWNRGTVFNTDPDVGDLSRMQSLRETSAFLAPTESGAALFSALSLSAAVRFRDQDPLPGYERAGGDALQAWDLRSDAAPPIRLLTRWRERPDAVAAFGEMPRLARGEVVVETGRDAPGSAPPGRVRALEDSPERLRLDVEAAAPTFLFVLRGFWPYRSVRVGGAPAEVVPAELAFSAVAVPAGRHRVEWNESAPGWGVSWLGPAAAAALALAGLRRRRAGSSSLAETPTA